MSQQFTEEESKQIRFAINWADKALKKSTSIIDKASIKAAAFKKIEDVIKSREIEE